MHSPLKMGIEDEIKKDELGNFIFIDDTGRELIADENKFSEQDESLCSRCIKDYKTCENEYVQIDIAENKVCFDERGYPLVMYCSYFLEK